MSEIKGLRSYVQRFLEEIDSEDEKGEKNKFRSYEVPADLYSPEEIRHLEEKIEKYQKNTIRTENLSLFESVEAQREILELFRVARKQYIQHLQSRGVDRKYLEELDHVTNDDSIEYKVAGIGADSQQKGSQEKDGKKILTADQDATKKEIVITAHVLESVFEMFKRNEAFSKLDDTILREMAARLLLYHEMTHSLQQAYLNYHGKYRKTETFQRVVGEKLSSIFQKKYAKFDSSGMLSEELESERQAEGVANDALLSFLGYEEGKQPILPVSESDAESALRRKRITSEEVKDDEFLNSLRSMIRLYLQHQNKVDVVRAVQRLAAFSQPQTSQALQEYPVGYWYGLLFPHKRKDLESLYSVLSNSPQVQPARPETTSPSSI